MSSKDSLFDRFKHLLHDLHLGHIIWTGIIYIFPGVGGVIAAFTTWGASENAIYVFVVGLAVFVLLFVLVKKFTVPLWAIKFKAEGPQPISHNPPHPPTGDATIPTFNVMGNRNAISIGQTGGITAVEYIVNAQSPREISAVQRTLFANAAKPKDGQQYGVSVRLNDGSNEGRQYLQQVLDLINSVRGWRANSFGEAANTLGDISGLRIEAGDPNNLPQPVVKLSDGFAAANIPFEIVRGPAAWNQSDFRIVIGNDPPHLQGA